MRDCGYIVVSYMYNAGVLLHTKSTPPDKMQEDRWGSSTSQSYMIGNFTIHIAFYAVRRSQHTHLQSHYMHNLLLPHINIPCRQGSHTAQWCFGPTSLTCLCSFFSSGVGCFRKWKDWKLKKLSYLVSCMHVLVNIYTMYLPDEHVFLPYEGRSSA